MCKYIEICSSYTSKSKTFHQALIDQGRLENDPTQQCKWPVVCRNLVIPLQIISYEMKSQSY